ncbi:MAG: amidohydrolase family protein, partial [Alistipes sp.]|nr:amidohydrolase family protein [Alistipes sp.]
LCETRTEIETIAQSYGKDPVTHLRDLGVFNYPTLAAHCVHITPPQMEILQKYRVSVSHNPQSNMKLSSGIAPVTQMQAMGINVGLGTDGCSSNNDLDLWEEMRTAALLQKVTNNDPCALPAYEVLKMATVHGAQAIGLEGELGIIAEGALADLLLIDLNAPHLIPCHDLISNLVYCAKASDVDSVIVGGEMVVRHRQLVHLKLSQIRAQILKRIARLTAEA